MKALKWQILDINIALKHRFHFIFLNQIDFSKENMLILETYKERSFKQTKYVKKSLSIMYFVKNIISLYLKFKLNIKSSRKVHNILLKFLAQGSESIVST